MAAQSKPPAKTSRISGFWVIVHIVRSALNWIMAPLLLVLLIIELSTPTLSYNANSDTVTYRDDQPAQDVVVTGFNGQSWPALRTTLVTHDYRNLKIDLWCRIIWVIRRYHSPWWWPDSSRRTG